MLFQRIVVAYDGSLSSKYALDKGIELVRAAPGARLHVVHVFHYPSFVIGEALLVAPPTSDVQERIDDSEAILEEAKARASAIPDASFVLLQGEPSRSLLEYADNQKADLIVLGSRGLGTLGELFLGSVSHYIVQHADIPVLVIKRPPETMS